MTWGPYGHPRQAKAGQAWREERPPSLPGFDQPKAPEPMSNRASVGGAAGPLWGAGWLPASLFQPTFQGADNGVLVHGRGEDHPIVNGVTA